MLSTLHEQGLALYLPGRSRALSRMSGRLVPPRMMTPDVVAKPSISTSNWLSVFSLSSLPPAKPPLPRARPMASISSAGRRYWSMTDPATGHGEPGLARSFARRSEHQGQAMSQGLDVLVSVIQ